MIIKEHISYYLIIILAFIKIKWIYKKEILKYNYLITKEKLMKKQTAGRDKLGEIAPKFAELNDDVLFGEVWSRTDQLSLRDRSIITVTALMTKGIFDSSLKYHITNAKNNGVSKSMMVEIVTHLAFYVGWPNA